LVGEGRTLVRGSDYGDGVSAMYSVEDEPVRRHPLAKGASPEAIRSHLLVDDRAEFDAELAATLEATKCSLDLTGLFTMLEQWRRIAALQSDPERFARVVRRAAEELTGQSSPPDEPLAVTRAKAGM
jgi:hypothetical protein